MFPQAVVSSFDYAEVAMNPEFWNGGWVGIFSTMFPITDGFVIRPKVDLGVEENEKDQYIIEVAMLKQLPGHFQTLLIAQIRHSNEYKEGISEAHSDLEAYVKNSFVQAGEKLYWITAMGSAWRCGYRAFDGEKSEILHDWHDDIKDEKSYIQMQELCALAREEAYKIPRSDAPMKDILKGLRWTGL